MVLNSLVPEPKDGDVCRDSFTGNFFVWGKGKWNRVSTPEAETLIEKSWRNFESE